MLVARTRVVPLVALALGAAAMSQSTQGLISGRVSDTLSRQAIAGATVICESAGTHTIRAAKSDLDGLYSLPLLPPGEYSVRVSQSGYQSKQQDEIRLAVAGSLELNFSLRPLRDLWESEMQSSVVIPQSGTILNFHGPDVDPNHWTAFVPNTGTSGTLEASISDAVSPSDISELPLNGNNIYAILLAEPGVTADAATSRSLGISANGQRPSSSNFLLDGIEANFNLISGAVVSIPPEATQEYRISTNNFSAEYGGAAGYLANTVTRSGGEQWHGLAYFDLENTILNANDFQANLAGLSRTPSHQDRQGAFVGGPIWKRRLFSGTSIQYFRSRSQMEPQSYNLPSTGFLQLLGCPGSGSYACPLLTNYPVPNSPALVGSVTLSQPVSVNQWLGIERLDYSPADGSQHVTLRVLGSNLAQPDFIWSPYHDYISGLAQPVYNIASNWTRAFGALTTNQFAAGWNDERLSWSRANPQVPTLIVTGGNTGQIPLLPGSPAAYAFDDGSRYLQAYDDVTVIRGRHILKLGAGGMWTRTDAFLGFGLGGEYLFCNIERFGLSLPGCPGGTGQQIPAIQFAASLARGDASPTQPDLARFYRTAQYYSFAQDTFRVTPRFSVELGIRFDYFGAPAYDGGLRDWRVQFGSGATFDQRVAGATLESPSAASSTLFSSGGPALAPRTAFAYNLWPASRTVVRGGFGLFYDRLFDNQWLNATNNSFVFASPVSVPTYLPVAAALQFYSSNAFVSDFPNLSVIQPHLHDAYAQDLFLGIQSEPITNWFVELNGAGSLGRRLITNDVINRNSVLNSSMPAMQYLSNQGLSDYYSLSLVTRWRMSHGFLQAAYTWSHAIDIQSDALAGNYFNLDFVNIGPAPQSSPVAPNGAAFSYPNDSRGDRASADFDQRQTLVFYSRWQIPNSGNRSVHRILGGFAFSELGAIRSGFPYSIFTAISPSTPEVINAHARPLTPHPGLAPEPVAGGERFFDASEFCADDTCPLPASGRNAFTGPGLINLDTSLSRAFYLSWLGEKGSLVFRADAFNFLNHPNLNPPRNIPGSSDYGVALFGTPPQTAGFPAVVPLTPATRTIQLTVRAVF